MCSAIFCNASAWWTGGQAGGHSGPLTCLALSVVGSLETCNLQIHNTLLLTAVTMLHNRSLGFLPPGTLDPLTSAPSHVRCLRSQCDPHRSLEASFGTRSSPWAGPHLPAAYGQESFLITISFSLSSSWMRDWSLSKQDLVILIILQPAG